MKRLLFAVLLTCAYAGAQQINPNSQIAWPANCSTANYVYSFQLQSCIPNAAGSSSPLTTKGDLYGFSTTNARIPVGSDGQVLKADSSQALGVKWDDESAGTPAGANGNPQI